MGLEHELLLKATAYDLVERSKRAKGRLDHREQLVPIFCEEALCLTRVKLREQIVEVCVTGFEWVEDKAWPRVDRVASTAHPPV